MGKIIKNSSGKVIVASGGAFEVTSAIDSNIVAGNIKKDVTILGVTGTYEGSGGGGGGSVSVTIDNELGAEYYYLDGNGDYAVAYGGEYPGSGLTLSCLAGSLITQFSSQTPSPVLTNATLKETVNLGAKANFKYAHILQVSNS